MILIRSGNKEDLPRALELVKELAEYERALPEVSNTVAMMEEDGFGANPVFGFFVAENSARFCVLRDIDPCNAARVGSDGEIRASSFQRSRRVPRHLGQPHGC